MNITFVKITQSLTWIQSLSNVCLRFMWNSKQFYTYIFYPQTKVPTKISPRIFVVLALLFWVVLADWD